MRNFDELKFNMACLNCLQSEPDFVKHTFEWENFEKKVKENKHPATWDFYATNYLKAEFYNKKRKCEYCGHTGAYDIYNLTVNGESYETLPDDDLPQIRMNYSKKNGKIDGGYSISGNIEAVSGMYAVANTAMNRIPKEVLIPQLKGTFRICVFQYDDDFCDGNLFNYAGFSYSEIEDLLKKVGQSILKKMGLS
jgi:hypothetical protein